MVCFQHAEHEAMTVLILFDKNHGKVIFDLRCYPKKIFIFQTEEAQWKIFHTSISYSELKCWINQSIHMK